MHPHSYAYHNSQRAGSSSTATPAQAARPAFPCRLTFGRQRDRRWPKFFQKCRQPAHGITRRVTFRAAAGVFEAYSKRQTQYRRARHIKRAPCRRHQAKHAGCGGGTVTAELAAMRAATARARPCFVAARKPDAEGMRACAKCERVQRREAQHIFAIVARSCLPPPDQEGHGSIPLPARNAAIFLFSDF